MAAGSIPGAAGVEADLTERIMEFQRREFALLSHVATREREMKSLRQQANEAVDAFEDMQKDSLRGAHVDPVINVEVAILRQQLREKDQEIKRLKEEAQNSQFQPSSLQGQKLLRKCAHLLDENAELGRQLGEERLQVLRIQLTAEHRRRAELRQRATEFDRRAEQIDAENEVMGKKIAELGQILQNKRADIEQYKRDIEELRSGGVKRKRTDEEKQQRAAEKAARAAAGAAGTPLLAAAPLAPAVFPAPVPEGQSLPVATAPLELDGGDRAKRKKKKDKAVAPFDLVGAARVPATAPTALHETLLLEPLGHEAAPEKHRQKKRKDKDKDKA